MNIQEAAKEYADGQYEPTDRGILYGETQNDFVAGAEWQVNQTLPQEQIDTKLSEYINSTKVEDKLKIGQFSLITISSMAIDANSAKTTLSTEFTHKGKRYKAEMLITQKEIKSEPRKKGVE